MNSSSNAKFYRVTYESEGIYNALRKHISCDDWIKFLSLKEVSWLPKPPIYSSNYLFFFTELGYQKFMDNVFPILCRYLDKEKIIIDIYDQLDHIIATDLYQVIISNN